MTDHRYLITTVEDGVGILQLNHPEKRNALGWELHEQLIAALEAWAYDDGVAAVLLIGNEDYFCAGWPSTSCRAPAATTGPGSPTGRCG